MPWFRPPPALAGRSQARLDRGEVMRIVASSLRPAHFVTAGTSDLLFEGPVLEEIPWELFRGKLLPDAQTRVRRRFMSWHVRRRAEDGTAQPLLSVRFDGVAHWIYVTRGLHCTIWE